MKQSPVSTLPSAGLMKFIVPTKETENSLHIFSDREWLAIRHQQMDIAPNCIFPIRERKNISHYLQSIRAILVAMVKLPVRI